MKKPNQVVLNLIRVASIFCLLVGAGELLSQEPAAYPIVQFEVPESQEFGNIYVENKSTGKKLIMSSSGNLRLLPRQLEFLGIRKGQKISAGDFTINRLINRDQLKGFEAGRRKETEAWIKGPGEREIVFEPLKIVSTELQPNVVVFKLRENYILMAQADLSHLAALKIKAKSAAEKRMARKRALELFEESWSNLQQGKFDRSLIGFEALKENSWTQLTPEERQRLVFGLSLSRFHQLGCASAYDGFKSMLQPGEYENDSRYYAGLCALDANETKQSKEHFSKLVELDDPKYVEESRFYLGVVAEAEDDYAMAESAYLDTIDFASKDQLVKLAKARLDTLNAKKARKKYENKIFSFMLNTGVGYDTNALSLSASTEPSTLNLTTGASPSYLALAFVDVKNSYLYPLQQKFFYSYLMLGYTNTGIAETTDVQSHDFGANVSWGDPFSAQHTVTASGNLSYLGKLGSTSAKYLTGYNAKWDISQFKLNQDKQLDQIWTHSFKLSRSLPARESSDASSDATAWIVTGDHKLRYVRGNVGYGYLGGWELRLAKGSENSNVSAEFGGHYDQPLLEKSFKLNFSQELTLNSSFYYSSAESRKDFLLASTSSVSHMLNAWLESRFQLILNQSFSSSDAAKYNRIQGNLLLTAFF